MADTLALRDSALATWSTPVRSQQLQQLHGRKTDISKLQPPKLHREEDVMQKAASNEGEKRLTAICEKPEKERTDEEARFVCQFMQQHFPFFRLWPDNLQHELSMVLNTEILVQHETIMSRGMPLNKVYFILNGKLDVLVPNNPFSRNPEIKTMATLKRWDTCGEAALLGSIVSHSNVVVTSNVAVLLSLSSQDFLKAFKEIMGLRQQDRLMYLRMHPLFSGLTLGQLETLSDALQPAFHPPGVTLYPAGGRHGGVSTASKHRRPPKSYVYLLQEGQCAVKRLGKETGDGHTGQAMYDSDTVSVLGALDIFGLPQPVSVVVETLTPVHVYQMAMEDYQALPACIRKLVENANSFKTGYYHGRLEGLSKLDLARKGLSYGQFMYKVGDVVMTSMGNMGNTTTSPSQQQQQQQRAITPSTRMHHMLMELTSHQVLHALDAHLPNDRTTGLPPITTTSQPGPHSTAVSTSHSHKDASASATKASTSRPWEHSRPDHSHAPHPLGMCGLSLMHPDAKALPRVSIARQRLVETEAPGPQPVPYTARQRHLQIFHRACHMAPRTNVMMAQESSDMDDEDEERLLRSTSGAPGHASERQPSRRLSGDRRGAASRQRSSHSASDHDTSRPSTSTSVMLGDAASRPVPWPGAYQTSQPSHVGALDFLEGRGSNSSDSNSLPGSARSSRRSRPNDGGATGVQLGDHQDDLTDGFGSAFHVSKNLHAMEGPGLSDDESVSSHEMEEGARGLMDSDLGAAGDAASSSTGEQGLNSTLRKTAGSRSKESSGSSHSSTADVLNLEFSLPGAKLPVRAAMQLGMDAEQGVALPAGQHGSPSRSPQKAHQQARVMPEGVSAGAGSQASPGPGHKPVDSSHHSLTADTLVVHSSSVGQGKSPVKPALQLQVPPSTPPQQQQQQLQQQHATQGVNLPPAVVLGYEGLDPFQWAALMSYAVPSARSQGSQDNILPKPKW